MIYNMRVSVLCQITLYNHDWIWKKINKYSYNRIRQNSRLYIIQGSFENLPTTTTLETFNTAKLLVASLFWEEFVFKKRLKTRNRPAINDPEYFISSLLLYHCKWQFIIVVLPKIGFNILQRMINYFFFFFSFTLYPSRF